MPDDLQAAQEAAARAARLAAAEAQGREEEAPLDAVGLAVSLVYASESEDAAPQSHLSQETMLAYLRKGKDRNRVMKHLAACDSCARRLAGLNRELRRNSPIPTPVFSLRQALAMLTNPGFAWAGCLAAILVFGGLYWNSKRERDSMVALLRPIPVPPMIKEQPMADAAPPRPQGQRFVSSYGPKVGGVIFPTLTTHDIDSLRTPITPVAIEGGRQWARVGSQAVIIPEKPDAPNRVLTADVEAVSSPTLQKVAKQAGAGDFSLVSPNLTAIADLQPVLTWKPLKGKKYTYEVDVATPEDETPRKAPIPGPSSRLPHGLISPGKAYSWWIVATSDDGDIKTSDHGRFAVVDEQTIEKAHRLFSDPNSSHLSRLDFAMRAGLLDDALREIDAIQFKDDKTKQRLLDSIKAAHKRNEDGK